MYVSGRRFSRRQSDESLSDYLKIRRLRGAVYRQRSRTVVSDRSPINQTTLTTKEA